MSHLPVRLDESLLRVARTWGHASAAERKVARFSLLGEHAGVWLVLGAAETLRSSGERRLRWARATGAVAGTYAANTALKLTVRRVRPHLPGLPPLTSTPTRFSFPSAHSSTSFAGALAYSRAGFPAPPLYALAVGLALSRLYLGVHYPSDVLAGALLGLTIAGVCTAGTGASSEVMADGERVASDAQASGTQASNERVASNGAVAT
jgi:membrane-associated phospholipid phosphatase